MDRISAPWRMEYIKGQKPAGCIFCEDSLRSDELLLYQGKRVFVMMNKYPYTSGHLMVVPVRHVNRLEALLPEERYELFGLVCDCAGILEKAMNPHGFNVGMNLGRAAGAGVEDHLHIHIVPRWNGDTNFMCSIGEVRVISDELKTTRALLRELFEDLTPPVEEAG